VAVTPAAPSRPKWLCVVEAMRRAMKMIEA
jgi:hypothetical protein